MRTVTYNAGAYLVEELQRAGIVARFVHDGGDIILFETWQGARVSIHLIESSIEHYEIGHILAGNDREGIYTLFILWADRLLPGDGQRWHDHDWLTALYSLHDGQIFAYDIYGLEIFVFPVYFDRAAPDRRARYGTTVNFAHLDLNAAGRWRVAGFTGHRPHTQPPDVPVSPLQEVYDVLGVDEDDDREVVKKAYRLLARRYHPDLNRSPDATRRMQQINEAYARLMAYFDDV